MLRFFLLYLILFLSFPGYSQDRQLATPELIEVAKEMMNEAIYCALITTDSTNQINVRTMQPFAPDDDLIVWFGTNSKSRKVRDIVANDKVTLYYDSPDKTGYVVLNGKALLVTESSLKEKYWMKEWKDFYEKDKSNYLLIQFIPETIELLNTEKGISGNKVSWEIPELRLK